jgi:hypothetical protein
LKKLGWEGPGSSGSSKCNLLTRIRGGLVLPYFSKSCVQLNATVQTVHSRIVFNDGTCLFLSDNFLLPFCLFTILCIRFSFLRHSKKREKEKFKFVENCQKEKERSVVQDLHSLSVSAAVLPVITVTQSYYLFGTGYDL